MGLVVRFPLELAQSLPPVAMAEGGASIIVLPVIRIERVASAQSEPKDAASKPRSRSGSRSRRRARRPA